MTEQDCHDFNNALDTLANVLDAPPRDPETKRAYFLALQPYRFESFIEAMNWLGGNFVPTRINRFPVPAQIAERINSIPSDKDNYHHRDWMIGERRMNLGTYLSELPADHPDHKFWAEVRAFNPNPKKPGHRSSPKSLAQIIL